MFANSASLTLFPFTSSSSSAFSRIRYSIHWSASVAGAPSTSASTVRICSLNFIVALLSNRHCLFS